LPRRAFGSARSRHEGPPGRSFDSPEGKADSSLSKNLSRAQGRRNPGSFASLFPGSHPAGRGATRMHDCAWARCRREGTPDRGPHPGSARPVRLPADLRIGTNSYKPEGPAGSVPRVHGRLAGLFDPPLGCEGCGGGGSRGGDVPIQGAKGRYLGRRARKTSLEILDLVLLGGAG